MTTPTDKVMTKQEMALEHCRYLRQEAPLESIYTQIYVTLYDNEHAMNVDNLLKYIHSYTNTQMYHALKQMVEDRFVLQKLFGQTRYYVALERAPLCMIDLQFTELLKEDRKPVKKIGILERIMNHIGFERK